MQIKVFDSPSKQTLQITLKNRLNLNSTYSMEVYFDCKVAKNFTFDDEFKTKQKYIASKGQFRQPDVANPIIVTISSITEFGLVTITYNQNLLIDDKYLIVEFEQLSAETAIDFNWTLTSSLNQSLQIQLNFSRPLAVSMGKILDRLHVYLPIVIQG